MTARLARPAQLELVSTDRERENALVRSALAGDEGAFERIYSENAGRVFALCCRMSGSRARAAELTQDVFVHVWRQLAKWRGESALATWIHRLTVNLVLSNARGEQRRLKHEMASSELETDDDGLRVPEHGGGSAAPADVVNAIDLERAIASLPAGARAVFVLHDVEGYKHDEIAKMTGTAEGTCRAQLHRARQLLIQALGGRGDR
jgi:RNA polymerase sigma-70 factor (ECF subfamily)